MELSERTRQSKDEPRSPRLATVGVSAPGGRLKAWQKAALLPLVELGVDKIVVLPTAPPTHSGPELPERLESALFHVRSTADQSVDVPDDGYFVRAGEEAGAVDLVVRFTSSPEDTADDRCGRLGTVEYRFDGFPQAGALVHALLDGRTVIPVSVWHHAPDAGSPVLLVEATPAFRSRRFLGRAKDDLLWKAAQLLSLSIQALLGQREPDASTGGPLRRPSRPEAIPRPEGARPGAAGLVEAGRHVATICGSVLRRRVERPFYRHDHWFLAYRERQPGSEMAPPFDGDGWMALDAPSDRFYADPFVIHSGGADHVFFEDFRYSTQKGVISWMMHLGQGRFSAPQVVLERPWHLSYPFVFQFRGSIFMMPESADANRLELFEAVEFPTRWRPVSTLMEGVRVLDATLHHEDGRWWMFAGVDQGHGTDWDTLHLFHAPEPFGPWRPHRANPIKIDSRGSRPAGGLFRWGDRLVRPAQNCSRSYGGSVVLFDVLACEPSRYSERVIGELTPDRLPGSDAVHTLSFGSDIVMVDGRRRRQARW